MHIGVLKLHIEVNDLSFLLVHDERLRVHILGGDVGDLTGTTRIVQRAQVLFEVLVTR